MALRLPYHGEIGVQATGGQLAQDFLVGARLAAWRIDVFDANQPAALVSACIQPAVEELFWFNIIILIFFKFGIILLFFSLFILKIAKTPLY